MESKHNKTIHVEHGYEKNAYTYYPVLIVGAGETGIAMGCQLKSKLGFDQFRIFERQSGIGGTWWINRYPGVAVDIPCAMYSYSFEPLYDSGRTYPTGRTMVQYLHRVASKYQIIDKIQLNTDITELRWLEDEKVWEATITHMSPGSGDMGAKDREAHIAKHGRESVYLKQEKVRAKIVVSAVGGLVEPKAWPDHIPGADGFKGEMFHTARWRDDVELKDKNIVLIGTGSTSVQVAQALLDDYEIKSITQLMRTPPWVVPKAPEPDRSTPYPTNLVDGLVKYPSLGPVFRYLSLVSAELDWLSLFVDSDKSARAREKYQDENLARMRQIAPKKYHEMLTPDYPVGCKRRIVDPTPGWLHSMNDPRFTLTTQRLLNVTPEGITVSGNQTYPANPSQEAKEDEVIPADVIILANGYDIRDWLHPLKIHGKGGKSIHDVWKERGGPQAYMCSAMDGFPNLFILNGPNIYTGHHSVIFASENVIVHTLKLIKGVLLGDVDTLEVKKSAEMKWTKDIQRELKNTVFASPACTSWYKVESGWNSTTYPRSQTEFMLRCYFPRWKHWDVALTRQGHRKQSLKQTIKYSTLIALIAGTYWARKNGTSLLTIVKGWTKVRLNMVLQILTLVLMKVQDRLQ